MKESSSLDTKKTELDPIEVIILVIKVNKETKVILRPLGTTLGIFWFNIGSQRKKLKVLPIEADSNLSVLM